MVEEFVVSNSPYFLLVLRVYDHPRGTTIVLLPTVDGRNPAPPRDLGCIKPYK